MTDTKVIEKAGVARRALGRGLESLLPARAVLPQVHASDQAGDGKPLEIPLDNIERNPFQTRASFDEDKLHELMLSIQAQGVVQPIVVRALGPDRYQLIAGERRFLASRQAGKQTIPAIVREASDEQVMEMTIVENLQRADLNPMEQARAFQRLSTDFRMTQEKVALRTGKERATVANFMRLLRLPDNLQEKVATGELSFGHAKILLSLENHERMRAVAQKVASLSLSVRETETYVQAILNPEGSSEKPPKIKEPTDPNVLEAQMLLQRTLGLRVRIEDRHGRGRVIIDYANLEDFDLLVDILTPQPNGS